MNQKNKRRRQSGEDVKLKVFANRCKIGVFFFINNICIYIYTKVELESLYLSLGAVIDQYIIVTFMSLMV